MYIEKENSTTLKNGHPPLDGWPLLKSSFSLSVKYFFSIAIRLCAPLLLLIGLRFYIFFLYFNHLGTITFVASISVSLLDALIFLIIFCTSSHYLYNRHCGPKEYLGLRKLLKQSYVQLTKDGLKVAFNIVAGLLLFILPGIWFIMKYVFVPFIDFFHKDSYSKVPINTLKHSGRLTQNIRFPLLVVLLIWMSIPMGFEFFVSIKTLPELMGLSMKAQLVSYHFLIYLSGKYFLSCVEIFFCTFLFFLYVKKDSSNIVLDWNDPSLVYSSR